MIGCVGRLRGLSEPSQVRADDRVLLCQQRCYPMPCGMGSRMAVEQQDREATSAVPNPKRRFRKPNRVQGEAVEHPGWRLFQVRKAGDPRARHSSGRPLLDTIDTPDWSTIPAPTDDGAADHFLGMSLPPVTLHATDGSSVDLSRCSGRLVLRDDGEPDLAEDVGRQRRRPGLPPHADRAAERAVRDPAGEPRQAGAGGAVRKRDGRSSRLPVVQARDERLRVGGDGGQVLARGELASNIVALPPPLESVGLGGQQRDGRDGQGDFGHRFASWSATTSAGHRSVQRFRLTLSRNAGSFSPENRGVGRSTPPSKSSSPNGAAISIAPVSSTRAATAVAVSGQWRIASSLDR